MPARDVLVLDAWVTKEGAGFGNCNICFGVEVSVDSARLTIYKVVISLGKAKPNQSTLFSSVQIW